MKFYYFPPVSNHSGNRIKENLKEVRKRIDLAARKSGRSGGEITLVAVTKTFPVEHIKDAVAAGIIPSMGTHLPFSTAADAIALVGLLAMRRKHH